MTRVERALISVSDKRGVVELARDLAALGVKVLSTGGTAKALREAGVPVLDVAAYTGSPEVMAGRVKTLHPRVHGGILSRDTDSDREDLSTLGGKTIDLVCVNLYPFEATVARGAGRDEVIENIDIGGPSMLRSAAKNQARVTVVTDPDDYPAVVAEIRQHGETSQALRSRLAQKAFQLTARYDAAIADYLKKAEPKTGEPVADATAPSIAAEAAPFPGALTLGFEKAYELRYGENPHQRGAFYVERGAPEGALARARSVGAGGKELSFNNFVDCNAAWEAVRELGEPAAVVVKHTNPCGVAYAQTLAEAYVIAREADALSAFGGVVALNREVDDSTAARIAETFIECVVAPGFSDRALAILHEKKNLRLLATGTWLSAAESMLELKRIGGGLVVQERDTTGAAEIRTAKVASERPPTDVELRGLTTAWLVAKHVKSNAIVLAKENRTVGVGAGQMSRVVSVEIAAKKAGEDARGSVMGSDAFFPFPDGVERAAEAGVTAVVSPGGSKKDDEVVAAANRAGMAMLFTGIRHFRH